jgi:hypothetical protein
LKEIPKPELGLRQLVQGGLQFRWFEPKRTGLALEHHPAITINQIETVWPTGVRNLSSIVEAVDNGGKLDAELANARAGNLRAFFFILRTGKDDRVTNIAAHLPNVAGMSFLDIHGVKRHPASVLLIQLVQGGNLPPKWRSSVAAEDQHYRLLLAEGRKLHLALMVQRRQPEVGRLFTCAKSTCASPCPKGLERDNEVRRQRHFRHDTAKLFGWLPHRPIDEHQKDRVAAQENNPNNNQGPLGGKSHEKFAVSYHYRLTASEHGLPCSRQLDKRTLLIFSDVMMTSYMDEKGPDSIGKAASPEPPKAQTKIRIIEDREAAGETAAAYDFWRAGSGRQQVPGIIKCFGSRPDFLRQVVEFSNTIHFSEGHLLRRHKEMIASYVSYLNRCPY